MKLRVAVPATLAALTALSAAPLAQAKGKSAVQNDDYGYKFKDDPLNASGAAAGGWVLKIRQKAARSTLIRPRTSFVMEMFKSVEKL